MFHHVSDEIPGEFSLPVKEFESAVDYIRSAGAVSLEDLLGGRKGIALTFDDVPEDFFLNAYPILKGKGVPFTLFIAVSYINRPGFLSEAQIKELSADPLATIGSHGIDHVCYSALSEGEKIRQWRESRQILESLTGRKINYFAYPYGSEYQCGFFGKRRCMQYYDYAFGTISAPIISLSKKWFLPRINITTQVIKNLR